MLINILFSYFRKKVKNNVNGIKKDEGKSRDRKEKKDVNKKFRDHRVSKHKRREESARSPKRSEGHSRQGHQDSPLMRSTYEVETSHASPKLKNFEKYVPEYEGRDDEVPEYKASKLDDQYNEKYQPSSIEEYKPSKKDPSKPSKLDDQYNPEDYVSDKYQPSSIEEYKPSKKDPSSSGSLKYKLSRINGEYKLSKTEGEKPYQEYKPLIIKESCSREYIPSKIKPEHSSEEYQPAGISGKHSSREYIPSKKSYEQIKQKSSHNKEATSSHSYSEYIPSKKSNKRTNSNEDSDEPSYVPSKKSRLEPRPENSEKEVDKHICILSSGDYSKDQKSQHEKKKAAYEFFIDLTGSDEAYDDAAVNNSSHQSPESSHSLESGEDLAQSSTERSKHKYEKYTENRCKDKVYACKNQGKRKYHSGESDNLSDPHRKSDQRDSGRESLFDSMTRWLNSAH